MTRYLLFAPLGSGDDPDAIILGAYQVPACFRPTDAFIGRAAERGMDVLLYDTNGEDCVPLSLLVLGKQLFERVSSSPLMN